MIENRFPDKEFPEEKMDGSIGERNIKLEYLARRENKNFYNYKKHEYGRNNFYRVENENALTYRESLEPEEKKIWTYTETAEELELKGMDPESFTLSFEKKKSDPKDQNRRYYRQFALIKDYKIGDGLLSFCRPYEDSCVHVKFGQVPDAEKEVDMHENLHMLNPGAGEGTIRNMARYNLFLEGTQPVYHTSYYAGNPY